MVINDLLFLPRQQRRQQGPDLSRRVHAPRARSFHTWHKSVSRKREMSFSDLLCFIALLLGFLFRFRSDKTLIIIALMHKMSWKKLRRITSTEFHKELRCLHLICLILFQWQHMSFVKLTKPGWTRLMYNIIITNNLWQTRIFDDYLPYFLRYSRYIK